GDPRDERLAPPDSDWGRTPEINRIPLHRTAVVEVLRVESPSCIWVRLTNHITQSLMLTEPEYEYCMAPFKDRTYARCRILEVLVASPYFSFTIYCLASMPKDFAYHPWQAILVSLWRLGNQTWTAAECAAFRHILSKFPLLKTRTVKSSIIYNDYRRAVQVRFTQLFLTAIIYLWSKSGVKLTWKEGHGSGCVLFPRGKQKSPREESMVVLIDGFGLSLGINKDRGAYTGEWQRVEILSCDVFANVLYLDSGGTELVLPHSLYKIHPTHCVYPPMCMQLCMYGVGPNRSDGSESDQKWGEEAKQLWRKLLREDLPMVVSVISGSPFHVFHVAKLRITNITRTLEDFEAITS
ncbi:unnamed protein product, partial [Heligmosomoides polygyrus]|uniref:Tudor domain-containing protein n=1 Tax=Heligmosomoides polygyrus TaxID=6339 RepID=A0A183G3F1_HELPZ